jgi:hypothetical protein
MTKMKKYLLKLDEDLDFDVIGISSHQLDYRLVWSINASLRLHLTKAIKPLMVYNEKKNEEISFPVYGYQDELDRVGYYLLKNKSGLDFLIPEAGNMDYFLFLTNNHAIVIEQFVTELRRIETVLAAFIFDNQKHKSFQYLEFN